MAPPTRTDARTPDIFMFVDVWTKFWTWVNENQLAATVVGGIIVALLVWLFSALPKVGPQVRAGLAISWTALGCAARWIWSWRPISGRRYARERMVLLRAIAEGNVRRRRLAKRADDAINQVRGSIPDVTVVLLSQIQENKELIDELRAEVDRFAKPKTEGLKVDHEANKRAAAASLPIAPPLPRPRWHAGPDNVLDPDQYVIQNMVPRSVAREVRVESDDMDIIDAGHWEDLSTTGPMRGTGTFIAVANERGTYNGVDLTITWYDEKGEKDFVRKTIWPKCEPQPEDEKPTMWVIPSKNDDTPS